MKTREWVWEVGLPGAQAVETLHSNLVGVRTVKSISRTSEHTLDLTTSRIPGWAIFLAVILTPLWLLARSNGTFRIRVEDAQDATQQGCRVRLNGAVTRPLARRLTALYEEIAVSRPRPAPTSATAGGWTRTDLLDRVIVATGALGFLLNFVPTGAVAEGRVFVLAGGLLALAAAVAVVIARSGRMTPDSARTFGIVALWGAVVALIVSYFDIAITNHGNFEIGYWLVAIVTAAGAVSAATLAPSAGPKVPGAVGGDRATGNRAAEPTR